MARVKARINPRIKKAADDLDILTRGVVENMRVHGMCHRSVKKAMMLAQQRLLDTPAGGKRLSEIAATKEIDRLRRVLVAAYERYPRILHRIVTIGNLSAVGRRYKITRERVRQFKDALFDYAAARHLSPREGIRDVSSYGNDGRE